MRFTIYLCFISLFLLSSCSLFKSGSPDEVVKIEKPCTGQKYQTSGKVFRASANGESNILAGAEKKAMSRARTIIAQNINVVLKAVEEDFMNLVSENNIESAREKFTSNTRTVMAQELSGAITICEESTYNKKTEKYTAFVAMELSASKLAEKMASQLQRQQETLDEDSELKVIYDYERFKDTFNEEMEKLGQ